ncbi:hypothetical protein [Nocardia sp. NPDC059239]|uniref:hypothetical protein n=1 Tax=unclassified Nocardia TaxID=2637762 RepID=UPI0036A0C872
MNAQVLECHDPFGIAKQDQALTEQRERCGLVPDFAAVSDGMPEVLERCTD